MSGSKDIFSQVTRPPNFLADSSYEWEHQDFVWNAIEDLARMVVELRRLDRLMDRVPPEFAGRENIVREFVDLNFFLQCVSAELLGIGEWEDFGYPDRVVEEYIRGVYDEFEKDNCVPHTLAERAAAIAAGEPILAAYEKAHITARRYAKRAA